MTISCYHILDKTIVLDSDSAAFLRLFHLDYHRFEEPLPKTTDGEILSFYIRIQNQNPRIRVCDRTYPAEGHPAPEKYAYQVVLWELFGQSRDFFLLHAGVVSKNDQAVIISGYPGTGKTTLVLALLKYGFLFYSDEICPIHKKTGWVHPFLRTPWVKTDSPSNTACDDRLYDALRKNKIPYEIQPRENRQTPRPIPPKYLICIDPGRECDLLPNEIHVCLKSGGNHRFAREVSLLGKTVESQKCFSAEMVKADPPFWKLIWSPDAVISAAINALLDNFRDHVWNFYRVHTIQPDFIRAPVLREIPPDRAALFVLNEIRLGTPLTSHNPQGDTTPGQFFMELCEQLAAVKCYRLTPGRLEDMLNHILNVTAP